MDVFISWSGLRSKYVAECLAVWLKQVIQLVRPWISSENILAGARPRADLMLCALRSRDLKLLCAIRTDGALQARSSARRRLRPRDGAAARAI